MAKKKEAKAYKGTDDGALLENLNSELHQSELEQEKTRDDPYCSWEEKECLFMGRNKDTASRGTKSQVFDPRLSTMVLERSARVMAQFPTGKVQALNDSDDAGKNMLMNLMLTKYVQPNANQQFDLLTKYRLVDIYSMVYGSYPVLIDWRTDDSYIGPDMWLIQPRSLFPQAGAISIEDAAYVDVETWVPRKWLEKRNPATWKNVDELMDRIGDTTTKSRSSSKKSFNEQEYQTEASHKGGKALVRIVTRYERDRWTTWSPEHELILRDMDNGQQNGEIPVVMKHCYPLIDRFWGLGDFERGKTLQYATNSLINLYLDGVKRSLFPPIIVNPNGVVASSIQQRSGAIWQENIPNSIRDFNTNPQGISTFQTTYGFMVAAMNNQMGTSGDTSVAKSTDPTQGKTQKHYGNRVRVKVQGTHGTDL